MKRRVIHLELAKISIKKLLTVITFDREVGWSRVNDKCHFCGKSGHFQKDCLKCKTWFEKKGKHNAYYVCFESNLTEVPHNSW